jgi:hypothetical protein
VSRMIWWRICGQVGERVMGFCMNITHLFRCTVSLLLYCVNDTVLYSIVMIPDSYTNIRRQWRLPRPASFVSWNRAQTRNTGTTRDYSHVQHENASVAVHVDASRSR